MYGGGPRLIETLKIDPTQALELVQCVEHRHAFLKSGRGTIKTTVSWIVRMKIYDQGELVDYIDIHHGTRKSDAKKIYKLVAKHGLETYQRIERDAFELKVAFDHES